MLHIRLDFNYLRFNVTSSFTAVTIKNMTDKNNINSSIIDDVQMITIDWFNNAVRILAYSDNVGINLIGTYTGGTLGQFFTYNYAQFVGNVTSGMTTFREWIDNRVIQLDQDGYTSLQLFRLNDTRNKLSKTITFYDIVEGQFKNPIGIKQITIDVVGYPISSTYNYVYIKKLNRYYYISDVAFVSAELTRLILVEDVLMSWATLIRGQSAFVTRQVGSSENYLVDNRLPLEDKLTVEYIRPTGTIGGLKNVTLDFSQDIYGSKNVLLSTVSSNLKEYPNSSTDDVSSIPTASLPAISSRRGETTHNRLMSLNVFSKFVDACVRNDEAVSYVVNALWLPFTPSTSLFPRYASNPYILCGKYVLVEAGAQDEFIDYSSAGSAVKVSVDQILLGVSPYLIIADFTYTGSNGNFLDLEPQSYYEMFIPFVGWISLNPTTFLNKRILVYYAIDFDTGISTAFVHNATDGKCLFSTNCQLGIKLSVNTSNALEITKQKQANDLNMILGIVGSAISIAGGVASGNPLVMAGGMLGFGKTIATAINSNNQLFTKGQINFGTSDNALHCSSEDIVIRRSYHKPITIDSTVYGNLQGKPYNNYTSLSSLTGYTEIGDIQFDTQNNDIYNVEIDEIVALLKNGVIL